MLIRRLKGCAEFVAGDSTLLREILHPDKQELKINYSLAYAKLSPGKASKPHRLKTSEVYYILEGNGVMHIDNQYSSVRAGYAVYIPPNSSQYIKNTGKSVLKFLCIVEPAWKKEDEKILL